MDLKAFTSRFSLQIFMKISTLPVSVDSVLGAGSQQSQKLNQLPRVTWNFRDTVQEKSAGEHLQIHRRDFRYLLSK